MTFDWQTEYARALQAFGGDTPGPGLEHQLLNAFQQHPQAVTNAITKIAKGYATGTIHSPWGALKTEIPKQIAADIHVSDGHERKQAIANTEQWMRNAGLMYDRWTEIHDELFTRGPLQPWRKDHALVARIEALWLELRPIGESIENEEIGRAEAWKTTRQAINNLPKTPIAQPHPETKAAA